MNTQTNNKKVLGIITARGGSKGIPGKNIKLLNGKPLLAYTIEAAKKSGALDRVIISTDDEAIAKVAREYGCEVPFLRPAEIAQDTTPTLPVLQHAVNYLKQNENYYPDYVMILQPTSPLRQDFHIKEAVELILKTSADSVLSVASIPETFSPYKAMVVNDKGSLELLNGNHVRKRIARRQDLPDTYWSIGSIYLFKTDLLFDALEPNFYGDFVAPYIVDSKYLVDINVLADWAEAEACLRELEETQEING